MQAYESLVRSISAPAAHFECCVSAVLVFQGWLGVGVWNWTIMWQCLSLTEVRVVRLLGNRAASLDASVWISMDMSLPLVVMMSVSGSTSKVCSCATAPNNPSLWSFWLGWGTVWQMEASTRPHNVCYDAYDIAIFFSVASWHACWRERLGAQHLEWKKQIPLT